MACVAPDILAAPIILLVALMAVPSPATAATPLCRAVNARTGQTYVGADQLHQAIDDAARTTRFGSEGTASATTSSGRSD